MLDDAKSTIPDELYPKALREDKCDDRTTADSLYRMMEVQKVANLLYLMIFTISKAILY